MKCGYQLYGHPQATCHKTKIRISGFMLGQYEISVYRKMHLDDINNILSVCILERTDIML